MKSIFLNLAVLADNFSYLKFIKRCRIMVLMMLGLLSIPVQAQRWIEQHTGLPATINPELQISAVDSNICWGIQTVYNPKCVLTIDGGLTWKIIDVEGTAALKGVYISAIDDQTAWITLDDPAGGSGSGIFKTVNGGKDWVRQSSAFPGSGGHPKYNYSFNADSGICIGNARGGSWEIYTTTNGGEFWSRVPVASIPGPVNSDDWIINYEKAGNSFWFCTLYRSVYKTTDMGTTWTVTRNYFSSVGFGMQLTFKDSLNGLGNTYFGEGINRVYRTSDGGAKWSPLPNPPLRPSAYFSAYIPGTDGSYIITSHNNIGHQAVTTPGTMYTSDNGSSWRVIHNAPNGQPSFSRDGAGWSPGAGDIIYKWEKPGLSQIYISQKNIDFGDVILGLTDKSESILIINKGDQSITINSISVNLPSFVLSDMPVFPHQLSPGDTISFKVSFIPEKRGTATGELNISVNSDPESKIFLSGNGILLGNQIYAFFDKVNSAPYLQRSAIVDSFLNANRIMPFIEQDTICCFLLRRDATSVNFASDANGWSINRSPMKRLSSTNLWYYPAVFESDARVEYKFVINGTEWISDPGNPQTAYGGFSNSEVRMPSYANAPEVIFYKDIPHGSLNDTIIFSNILGNSRTIAVYTPPLYDPNGDENYNLAIFHDGLDWIDAEVNNILDYLIYNQRIKPLIAVFVPPVNRDAEYIGDQQNKFADFIGTELMPYIDSRYRTKLTPENRANIGISNGGNIAIWIVNKNPEIFANAASFSGHIMGATSFEFENKPLRPLKLYLDAGTYDLDGFLDMTK